MKFKHLIVTSTALLTLSTSSFARLHNEAYYQIKFCNELNGEIEHRFSDGTRCDCITPSHAVEIEFPNKWYEGLGQALYYGIKANKKPGLGIVIEKPGELKYLKRLRQTIDYYKLPIDIFEINGIEERK